MKLIERPANLFQFQEWFDTHLKDHYAVSKYDLVRVQGMVRETEVGPSYVMSGGTASVGISDTHQAYLIKSSITEIKKETAAEYLGWLIKNANPAAYDITFGEGQYDKAKRILEES